MLQTCSLIISLIAGLFLTRVVQLQYALGLRPTHGLSTVKIPITSLVQRTVLQVWSPPLIPSSSQACGGQAWQVCQEIFWGKCPCQESLPALLHFFQISTHTLRQFDDLRALHVVPRCNEESIFMPTLQVRGPQMLAALVLRCSRSGMAGGLE